MCVFIKNYNWSWQEGRVLVNKGRAAAARGAPETTRLFLASAVLERRGRPWVWPSSNFSGVRRWTETRSSAAPRPHLNLVVTPSSFQLDTNILTEYRSHIES